MMLILVLKSVINLDDSELLMDALALIMKILHEPLSGVHRFHDFTMSLMTLKCRQG